MKTKTLVKITLCSFFLILAILLYIVTMNISPGFNDVFVKNRVQGNGKSSDDIVLVVIDGKSLQKQRWPWSREYYAEMFDFLENTAGAKVILFDAVLTSPDPYSASSDEKFYNYLKTTKKLIAGFDVCDKNGKMTSDECSVIADMDLDFDKKFDVNIKNTKAFIKDHQTYSGVLAMPDGFIRSINRLGSVAVLRDESDRIIRTYPHLVYVNGKYYPSLALAGYAYVKNVKDFNLTENSISNKQTGLKIPLLPNSLRQKQVSSYLRWYKTIDNDANYSHKEYSAVDVLYASRDIKAGKKPSLDPAIFKDKIVFVGGNASAQSLSDKILTPVSKDHAGVDIQATALNNYLDNSFTKILDEKYNIIITTIILLISFIIICYVPPITALAINFGMLLAYFVIYYEILLKHNIIVNYISVFSIEILLIAFAYIYQFMIEGEKKTKMQEAVGKYLSADVMQKVVKDGDSITLGGQKTDATIMFIDIRRFTTISENMSADDVSLLLNEYFTTIYPIITKYHGILNKFIGDAVLVIFTGSQSEESHAQNAILCADKVLQEVKKLQQKWIHEGKPRIDVGVGINSGEVFIGNIGTQERMEYTVIGDTVNTASRIEGYNKMYKTKFLIGENTFEQVKTYVDVIKINQVAIRGKTQKVNIYEILRIRK